MESLAAASSMPESEVILSSILAGRGCAAASVAVAPTGAAAAAVAALLMSADLAASHCSAM